MAIVVRVPSLRSDQAHRERLRHHRCACLGSHLHAAALSFLKILTAGARHHSGPGPSAAAVKGDGVPVHAARRARQGA